MKKILADKNLLTLIYKLCYDALFLLCGVSFFFLLAKSILGSQMPEILSPLRIFAALLITLGFTNILGKSLHISYPKKHRAHPAVVPIVVIVMFLLIGNAMLHFLLWQNLIITISALIIFFLFWRILFENKN